MKSRTCVPSVASLIILPSYVLYLVPGPHQAI